METITAKTPWAGSMGSMPMHLDYFEGSMFEAVEAIAEKYPNYVAFDFMGKSTTYKKLVQEVETCAKALKTIGVREGDKVTIAMPNCPQAIYMFYAVNRWRSPSRPVTCSHRGGRSRKFPKTPRSSAGRNSCG